MNGMENNGVDVSIASLVGPFRNVMSFFTHIRSAEACTRQLEDHPEGCMVPIVILHLRLARWGAALKLAEEVMSLEDLHAALRSREDVSTAKEKLASMANEFESIAKITRGRSNEEGNASATDNYQMTSRVLIQRIRGLADSRQCKAKTLRQVRWHLMLQKICHRSFRRQCKLSATRVNWIFRDEDESTLTGLIRKLSTLIGELEQLIPGDGSIATSCCEEEKMMLLPLAQPDSVQLSQLKLSVAKFDARLERAMGRGRYGTSPRALQVNKNGFFCENVSTECAQGLMGSMLGIECCMPWNRCEVSNFRVRGRNIVITQNVGANIYQLVFAYQFVVNHGVMCT